jgi:cytochrome c553
MRALMGLAGVMVLVYAGLSTAAETAAPAKPDVARGKQIASTVCVACHGADGNSVVPANPVLAGQQGDYIAAQLAAFKSGARPSPIMQGMAAPLSPEDMRSVGAWFESQKPTGHYAHDKALVERGQQI